MPSSPDSGNRQSTLQACKTFATQWLRLNWLDLVFMAVIGGVAGAVRFLSPIS